MSDKDAKKKSLETRKAFIECWVHANPDATKEDASALYDELEAKFPEMTRGGHRGLVNRQKPWEHVRHECTCCGFSAVGASDIANEFGFRTMRIKSGLTKYLQPCCPTCKNMSVEGRDKIRKKRGKKKYERVNPNTASVFTNSPSEGKENPAYSDDDDE